MAYKSKAQKKRESALFGVFLLFGGAAAIFSSFGLLSLYVQHDVVTGTMRGGQAKFVPAGTTSEVSVVSWFHDSGRESLREGGPVTVIVYPDGGHATSKSPAKLALYCLLGGLGAIGLGYVFVRF